MSEITTGITATEERLLSFDEDGTLSRQDCVDIFSYWPLGKRVVLALPRFAYSTPREIKIPDAPPTALEEFLRVSKRMRQDMICRRATEFMREFGMSAIAYVSDKYDLKDNMAMSDVSRDDGVFIAYDPLVLGGTTICQDTRSPRFLRPVRIMIGGKEAGSRRATTLQNGGQQYLKFNESTFTFGGPSVYQNMIPLIKGWTWGIVSLRRMAVKGSSVVFKGKDGGRVNGITMSAAEYALAQIRDMGAGGACAIDKNSDVSFFNMTGVQEVDAILKAMEQEIMLSLDDTPAAILLGKDLSNGLSEGSEDMKAVIMAVDNFREQYMAPLYDFTDPYVMARAWTNEFVLKACEGTADAGTKPALVRAKWEAGFSYEFGNLYPEPENIQAQKNLTIMQSLQIAKALGADLEDIQEEIRAQKIFKGDLELRPENITQAPPTPGMM